MSDVKWTSAAAKLLVAAAICGVMSIGLCGGGLVFSQGSSRLMGLVFAGGLVALGLAFVLGVAAFIVYMIGISKGPRY